MTNVVDLPCISIFDLLVFLRSASYLLPIFFSCLGVGLLIFYLLHVLYLKEILLNMFNKGIL